MDQSDRPLPAVAATGRKPFWKKRRYYLPLVVAAVANGAVHGGVTHRLATKQERLAREQASLTEALAAGRAELKELRSERERIATNEKTAVHFWSEVVEPREPGLTEALAEIDRLARESGVSRGRTMYQPELLNVGLTRVTATMPVRGSYFELVGFINRLERSPRFFLLQEIELAHSPESSDLALRCQLSFFFRPGEKVEKPEASRPSSP